MLLSCNQKPLAYCYLRYPICLYQVQPWLVGEEWGMGDSGEADLCTFGFVFPTGFSHREYRPLQLECCFCPFMTCLHCCQSARSHWAMGGWQGGIDLCICAFFFFLVMAAVPQQAPASILFLCSIPGLSFNVYQPCRPECCLCPSVYCIWGCNMILHYYCVPSGCSECLTASVILIFVLLPVLPPLLSQYAHLQISQCVNLSDMVEQEILCWIIVVQLVTSGRQTKRFFSVCHDADVTPGLHLK